MSFAKMQETVDYIKGKVHSRPEIGIVLGSGLGLMASEAVDAHKIDYAELPNFPVSTVDGHAGQLVFGRLSGQEVVMMKGRFHFYEGYSLSEVVFPIRVMKLLGVRILIVTNAAGGVNNKFKSGDLMIITDHLNLMGTNPLIGPNHDDLGPRFPDMSEAYNLGLISLAEQVAQREGLNYRQGVYAGLTGPSYETPAEIRYLRSIGADAVGMSTVPEVIVANHAGMRVLGISCITNMAAGVLPQKLNHEEVLDTADRVRDQFITLVKGILAEVKP